MSAQVWATLVVGVIGFGGVIAGIFQRTYADRRAEWWRRATWAADHALSTNPKAQLVGYNALIGMQASKLASVEDRSLFADWMESTFQAPSAGEGGRREG
jgi:hypothetical protein